MSLGSAVMAARRKEPIAPKGPEIRLEDGILLLRELKQEGEELAQAIPNESRLRTWYTSVEKVLSQTFGEDSGHLNTWRGPMTLRIVGGYGSHQSDAQRIINLFNERRQALGAIIEAGDGELRREKLIAQSSNSRPAEPVEPRLDTGKVFIVHGRNDAIREASARFVQRLGLNPVILHEEPNGGLTLLEKFEKHALTGYAIVIITGDDVGCLADSQDSLKPRARQNVIYELGFFAGAIGRGRVCALYQPGVELPSDLGGLAVVEIDPAEAWKFKVAREMKAAGLNVDLNDLA